MTILLSALFIAICLGVSCLDIWLFDLAVNKMAKGTDLSNNWVRRYWWSMLPGGGIVLYYLS